MKICLQKTAQGHMRFGFVGTETEFKGGGWETVLEYELCDDNFGGYIGALKAAVEALTEDGPMDEATAKMRDAFQEKDELFDFLGRLYEHAYNAGIAEIRKEQECEDEDDEQDDHPRGERIVQIQTM